ncbi:methyltransferase [Sphingobacterium paramultivorum]|uniref:Methyltransferase n=1 Tax=Sphingobacterium paramultivorum TaxID=2886510 RepID=A0A7G5E1J3_9SPHI|nr:DUF6250 domain-containing protein [Sphingobacterium paramultivorum]QMV67868.1 methyltransferase [Sphingobacterium paramultivorum]WSO16764.1 DUF6250 domain-containing protein [Sphingobacterium paramultivorum]
MHKFIKRRYFTLSWLLLIYFISPAQEKYTWKVPLNEINRWIIELEYPDKSHVEASNEGLVIDSYGGATLWLDTLLTGDYLIQYEREISIDKGENKRLSDLNQFWLAQEPHNEIKLKPRDGRLDSYNDLILFYVGIGGNNNSTTRFRRYDGSGERILLAEKNEKPFLLEPGRTDTISTWVRASKKQTEVWMNGRRLFVEEGIQNTKGYFGLRLTASRQVIKWLTLTKL